MRNFEYKFTGFSYFAEISLVISTPEKRLSMCFKELPGNYRHKRSLFSEVSDCDPDKYVKVFWTAEEDITTLIEQPATAVSPSHISLSPF